MDYMAVISLGVYPTSPTNSQRASYAVSQGLIGTLTAAVATAKRWLNLKLRT